MKQKNPVGQERDHPAQSQWEKRYHDEDIKKLGWFYPNLDPDLKGALADLDINSGTFLDLGTGPATQAMALSRLGFKVTATDISESAIERAEKLAHKEDLKIQFLQDDILTTNLTSQYDYIFDRGLFHVMTPESRVHYIKNINLLIKPGGFLFLKCFSDKQSGHFGPYRISSDEIRDNFKPYFQILSIVDTIYQGTVIPAPKALFCIMKK